MGTTTRSIEGQSERSMEKWHENAFFGLHYDLHANKDDTGLGKDLTVEHLVERLRRVQPDWVQCDCKGHPGYTSWPTEVGSPSPGIMRDALALHREATRQLGIPLGVHYSGVWDTRALDLHPDWARVDEHGHLVLPAPSSPDEPPSAHVTCRHSPYADELMKPQMMEVIDAYDVDGFWVDGDNWASKPCWCDRCQVTFADRTGIAEIPRASNHPHWDVWLAYHRDLFVEYVNDYAEAVHAFKPDCLVCSNWMYTVRQPDAVCASVDYLSGDCASAWGAERAAVEARLLDSRGLSWDLMVWAFTKAGDFWDDRPWMMKTATHLCQELVEAVALGGSTMIYDVPQRTGWLTDWHQDLLGDVADFCRLRKDACFKSKTVPQAAVLHLASHYYAHNQPLYESAGATDPMEGALHALLETHRSTDVLTEEVALERMNQYPLIVVPEQTRPSQSLRNALASYVEAGGHVLLSGSTAVADYPELVGATPGPGTATVRDRAMDAPTAVDLPLGHGAVPVAAPWQPVVPAPGTDVWTYCLARQEPEQGQTNQVAVTYRALGKGAAVTVHGPIFREYYRRHHPALRDFIAGLVDRLDIEWLVSVDAPPRLELIVREKDDKLLINLINRGAGETLSPRRVIVDELPPVEHVSVSVHRNQAPRSVSTVPADDSLQWSYETGTLTVHVSRIDIHTVVVID